MKYNEMRSIIKRLDAACGGHWFMQGAQEPEFDGDLGKPSQFKPLPRPEGAHRRKIWIGTTENTEPIAFLSDYLMPTTANAAFIAHARADILLLIKEITALNAELMHYRREESGLPEISDKEAFAGAVNMLEFPDSTAKQPTQPENFAGQDITVAEDGTVPFTGGYEARRTP